MFVSSWAALGQRVVLVGTARFIAQQERVAQSMMEGGYLIIWIALSVRICDNICQISMVFASVAGVDGGELFAMKNLSSLMRVRCRPQGVGFGFRRTVFSGRFMAGK
jgi:hypothetical protein